MSSSQTAAEGRPPLPPGATSASANSSSPTSLSGGPGSGAGSGAGANVMPATSAAPSPPGALQRQGSRATSRRMRLNFASNSVQFDTSTILEGFLYLGAKGVTADRQRLAEMKIGYILGVSEDPPPEYSEDIEYLHVSVGDTVTEDMSPYFDPACEFIERARCDHKGVLVHCTMGMSRSATLVLAYLVRHSSMSLAEALVWLKQRRPVASPNPGFMAQLVAFETSVRGQPSVDIDLYANNRFGEVSSYVLDGHRRDA